jgi:hypothetical protein
MRATRRCPWGADVWLRCWSGSRHGSRW